MAEAGSSKMSAVRNSDCEAGMQTATHYSKNRFIQFVLLQDGMGTALPRVYDFKELSTFFELHR